MNSLLPNNQLRIISRRSPLALRQVEEVCSLIPETEYELIPVTSYGDRHQEISLMGPDASSDFFTRELDEALLAGQADIAIHSAKDLPYPLPPGIEIICLTRGGDKRDALVTRDGSTLDQLPGGSRIGTSSQQRRKELEALRSDVVIVPIRGCIEERITQVDNGEIDALIVAACALDRLGLAHRASEYLPFATHPLQGNLAITASSQYAHRFRSLFQPFDIRRHFGSVKLVGFGPGDPELLTIKGNRALQEADVIFFDDLTNAAFLETFPAEKIYVGKRSGKHSHAQADINRKIYEAAISGRNTVRLKGGDPMLFSHGREEIDFLRSRLVEVSVIPGISSGNALASLLRIPLTHRGLAQSVAFVLGHTEKIPTPTADTLLYYMGGSRVTEIAKALLEAGHRPTTPVALVTHVSLPEQKILFSSLGELRYAVFRATPVLIMVGEVVGLEAQAHEMRIYHTGTTSATPLIHIEPLPTPQPTPEQYDWIIFTSRYGVRHYKALLTSQADRNFKIASVGPVTTAELIQRGICPDFESPTESAEGLVAFFASQPTGSILLPRSDKGLTALKEGLMAQGHRVTDLPVYANRFVDHPIRVDLHAIEKVEFSSPSAVEAFLRLYENIPDHLLFTAKGKTTYEAIQTIQTQSGHTR